MPQLGETVTEGTILSWAKQPGDTIAEDEVLLEISTDKVDTEVPSPATGVIEEILVAEGETVTVGTPLVVIGDGSAAGAPETSSDPVAAAGSVEEASVAAEPVQSDPVAPTVDSAPVPPDPQPTPAEPPVPQIGVAVPSVPTAADGAPRRGILSPVVRRLAADHGVDLDLVPGTGEGGRITRRDVMDHVAGTGNAASAKVTLEPAEAPAPATAPAPVAAATADIPAASTTVPAAFGGDDEVVQLSRLRTRIANNMAQAKATATHVWASVEVDYENVERVRRAHREAWKAAEGYSLTYLPFVVRATLDALGEYPVVNSSFFLDEGTQVFHGHVNLGIAVDMNQEGLVVVSVRRAEEKRLAVLAREIRGLAMKARDGKLDPDDISGSTFTITNPGPYGSFQTAPIINVPNVGILSTDTVVKRPTVVTMPDGSDAIAVHHIGYLGLSWDHRAFDGSTAVLFLNKIKDNLQTWDWEQELT
jgi:2-oxoglutarate dehydrogenase E2 component (dihydrolipoamide succinyltransferase)